MHKRAAWSSCVGGFGMGLITLTQTLSRPRLADVRAVDIVSLVGAGVSIGAGLVALIVAIRRGRA